MTDAELEQFIATNIHSVEEVEILTLLSRSPDTYWSADAMGQQLGIKAEVVGARARELLRRGLLAVGESGSVYRYAPTDEKTKEQVTVLTDTYRDRRITVINAIYTANLTRLRSFADAFKLGGGKP
ncbi:MAG TPA: hypothetical protein VM779_15610 [Thermoanaerobaculia bacterium]|nr:hypothetical protein [Thermoanaerobaculia bacterium]